jgi:hypothetical protein
LDLSRELPRFELTIRSPFWVKAISDRNQYLGGDGD